ncbi:MAG: cysteine--tRNA ligase [Eubacteriales bacterium]|nr:cysteine--tRNA ligase [Eubacteriales bacterium]
MEIYNTLTRKKEKFVPIHEGKIMMYVCGPTVYNYIHIGNARPMVIFDTFRKYMEYRGYEVKYVQNFTDVDDKIIRRAKEEGIGAMDVAEKYIKEYFEDADALNIKRATVHPRVSQTIPDIIEFVQTLIDRGYAYEADGDVYFSTRKFSGYGKLSGQNIDDLEAGARIAIGEVKKDPLDFALWKAQKEDREIAWDSPWGKGRPGWHIECSTMAKKHLAPTIDIHAGGQDLEFPHHENEIAQSECCNGVPFANYWMHNAYILMDKVKMSKSLGNFKTVREIRSLYDGEAIRLFLLSVQYRKPIDYTEDNMNLAVRNLERLQNCKDNLIYLSENGSDEETDEEKASLESLVKYQEKFNQVMDDDLNTADGISAVFELIGAINTQIQDGASKKYAEEALSKLQTLCDVLGILQKKQDESVDPEIQKLVDERQEARRAKNFARADEIRDQLKAMGITLKDTPNGVQIVKE